uniref:DUF1542 domain-containing protein n=1 Tax=Streptococcus pseudopneumoniae TaxID=257758 RepID=UPI001156AE07
KSAAKAELERKAEEKKAQIAGNNNLTNEEKEAAKNAVDEALENAKRAVDNANDAAGVTGAQETGRQAIQDV